MATGEGDGLTPHSIENEDMKSVVKVKNASLHILSPPSFSLLEPHTNLNEAPSNWLRQIPKFAFKQKMHNFKWQRAHREFSSIEMAANAPDQTGNVDVISNAKNIKKLLKIPYCKSHISMMVHRIGKTLLIDEFDIHKHLLRQQQDDWKWLRDFYFEYVKKDLQMKCVPKKNKTRDRLQEQNMLSKFLYHSILAAQNEDESNEANMYPLTRAHTQFNIVPDSVQESDSQDSHHREVLWMFEDLRMLIGTDLPIFSRGSNYPCISLRLRDMATPISVLTGLDYWLDNLMCNVPEVAMCFHMNGIVQKYEQMKTEDIPNIKNSEFDPQKVADIARNILSFLKSNATKEGHTYWLYKGQDDDVVKLYDLTSLAETEEAQKENPFTVPLGMLLYKVARNMWQRSNRKKAATIRLLLENCLILLEDESHPQVCTSARFLLSDLFVPDTALKDDWSEYNTSDSESEEDDLSSTEQNQDEECNVEMPPKTVDVNTLCVKNSFSQEDNVSHDKPITEDNTGRCSIAVQHIAAGLQCLDRDFTIQIHKKKNIVEEQAVCNSYEAIPLHYEPLQKSAPPHNESEPPLHDKDHFQLAESESDHTWHRLSKALLLRKAAVAFYFLAKSGSEIQEIGTRLKHIKMALRCFAGMRILVPKKARENRELLMAILELAGDLHLSFVQQHLKMMDIMADFSEYSEQEIDIIESVDRELESVEYKWVCDISDDMETNLQNCCRCYKEAKELATDVLEDDNKKDYIVSLTRRYGNMKNELGTLYMNLAQNALQSAAPPHPSAEMAQLCKKSQSCLDEGISIFESVSDSANMALLLSNKGRLMRLYAQSYTRNTVLKENPQFSQDERFYYTEAVKCYQRALELLKTCDKIPAIWESICWDLSTSYFNMAMLLQDYAPLSCCSQDEIEKEVTDLMHKSLRYCNKECQSARQPMYQYRMATVNHRLASLYHNAYRNQQTEQRKKYLRQLAETHYKKAATHFSSVECHSDMLRVTLEQVALLEYSLSAQTNQRGRLRILTAAVSCLADCQEILCLMCKQFDDPDLNESMITEGHTLTNILESRLQFILLQLIHTYSSTKKSKVSKEDIISKVKLLYAKSLKTKTTVEEVSTSLTRKWKTLISLLSDLKVFFNDILMHEPG